jgi:hypothetical protein
MAATATTTERTDRRMNEADDAAGSLGALLLPAILDYAFSGSVG